MAFVQFRQRHENLGRSVRLFRGALEVAPGHLVTRELLAATPNGYNRLCSARGDADCHFKATLGLRVVVAHAVCAAKVQQDGGIVRVARARSFEEINGFLVLLTFPRLGRLLKQWLNRAFGNRAAMLHPNRKRKAARLYSSSLC